MINRELIPYLKLAHGAYNTLVMSLLIYQGWLGLRIRKKRKAGERQDFEIIKRHRRNGPIFAIMGCVGFLAGITIIYFDKGRIFLYPLHFINGSLIALLLISTYLISKKIRANESPWRTRHFILGIVILCLYLIQVYLGLGILL